MKTVEVCDSSQVTQTSPYIVTVKNQDGKDYDVALCRIKGKVYAIRGACLYEDPI